MINGNFTVGYIGAGFNLKCLAVENELMKIMNILVYL